MVVTPASANAFCSGRTLPVGVFISMGRAMLPHDGRWMYRSGNPTVLPCHPPAVTHAPHLHLLLLRAFPVSITVYPRFRSRFTTLFCKAFSSTLGFCIMTTLFECLSRWVGRVLRWILDVQPDTGNPYSQGYHTQHSVMYNLCVQRNLLFSEQTKASLLTPSVRLSPLRRNITTNVEPMPHVTPQSSTCQCPLPRPYPACNLMPRRYVRGFDA